MNPESGVMNNKTLKVVPKSLFVTSSTVKKDEEGLIHVETKKNYIDLKTMGHWGYTTNITIGEAYVVPIRYIVC